MKKGVILAGGKGTRLLPATKILNKHLLPVVNVPMITFPLVTLKSIGITDILVISGGGHIGGFADYLKDGKSFGLDITYKVQTEAGGIAQALSLSKDFVRGEEEFAVILGDNIFEPGVVTTNSSLGMGNASIYLCPVEDNKRFGVPVFDPHSGKLTHIEEKPALPKNDLAVTGFYIYPKDVFEIVARLLPSNRGELEITDVNNEYIKAGRCNYSYIAGFWSDCGTPQSMVASVKWFSQYVFDKDNKMFYTDK